jgi:hypothetical protein
VSSTTTNAAASRIAETKLRSFSRAPCALNTLACFWLLKGEDILPLSEPSERSR